MKKGAASLLEVILIFGIATALAAVALPWAYNSIQNSLDYMEIDRIHEEFEVCDAKMIDTARTGTASKCIFSANRGQLSVEQDGIFYKIDSEGEICEENGWSILNLEKHLWQKCDKDINLRTLQFKWYYPKDVHIYGSNLGGSITSDVEGTDETEVKFVDESEEYEFRTLTVIIEFDFTEGQEGTVVDINRISLDEDKTTLGIKVS